MLSVVIIGGGIGGLCLAHGLRKAGVGVRVYEKGPKQQDSHWLQGYQIHINPHGASALKECLPPLAWEKVLANACLPSAAFQLLTEQLTPLAVVESELMNGTAHIPIVRTALRRVLLEGLDSQVFFEKDFVRYERTNEGVTVFFRDGSVTTADVLVGADGTGSSVRKHYLPQARIQDTGIVGAACRVPLTPEVKRGLPDHLLTRLTSILPPRSGYMIITPAIHKPIADKAIVGSALRDQLIWVFVAKRSIFGDADPKAMKGAFIQNRLLSVMNNWHPGLHKLVAGSDPEQVSAVAVLTSVPPERWEASNVSLLGDAIHTMTPLQGLGGSTALRDAALLCRQLVAAVNGACSVSDAVRDYERLMVDYAFRAVRRSATFGNIVTSDNWLLRTAFKTGLQLAVSMAPVKRHIFNANRWS